VLLPGCLENPDPTGPDPIQTKFLLYNFLMESYEVYWEIEGTALESSVAYGVSILGSTTLEEEEADVVLVVKEAGSDRIIRSETFTAEQYKYYLVSIMGTEKDPHMVFEPMDLSAPSQGLVRLRLLQSATEVGPVDLYIGGSSPDHKVLSGIPFTGVSPYIEAATDELWEAIIITPFAVSPADSTLLSYEANDVFYPDQVYLGVVGHSTNSPSSALQLILYNQP
jgi:hypothetical protein